MSPSDLEYWASFAQVISLPLALLALILQIITWFVPNPLSFDSTLRIYRLRSALSFIVVAAGSFWLGSRYFSGNASRLSQLHSADLVLILGTTTLIILIIFTGSISKRPNLMIHVRRQALIDTGNRLIRGAKRTVVMFGSDMSWASDYEESIRSLTSQGKEVVVLYATSQAQGVLRNAEILKNAGAILSPTREDSGIRGMLIDPQDHEDALLYTAYRKLKTSATVVKEGEKSSERSYDYYARIYDMKHDWLIIHAVAKYREILQANKI